MMRLAALTLALSCWPQSGLVGKFGAVRFAADSPNYYLEPGESLHPLMPASGFRGTFEGRLRVLAGGEYEFSRPLQLDGASGTHFKLNAGDHALVIPVNGERSLRLEWKAPAFDWEPVPLAAFSRTEAVETHTRARRLVANAGCANCHSLPASEALERPAPALPSRANRNWTYRFLQTHHGAGSHAADLAAAVPPIPPARKEPKINEVAIGKGGELFGTMGCVQCHPSGSLPAAGSKYSLAALAEVLESHRPSMLLDSGEVTALAAYLSRQRDAAYEAAAPAGDAAAGTAAMRTLSCAGCHQPGPKRKSVTAARCAVVATKWTAADQRLVADYLGTLRASVSNAPLYSARHELEKHRCSACHAAGAEAPDLEGVGAKLKTSWLEKVLWGKARIRPGREMRMPHFDESTMRPRVAALVKREGLAPGEGITPPAFEATAREHGLGLFGTNSKKRGMACIGCHDWGKNKALGEEGPQLMAASERLRYEWYERWMRNPARILSGTSMPSYFGGKADARIPLLWAAMDWGVKAPIPDGFQTSDLEVSGEAKPVPGKDAVVIRWDMPEATPAAIAVGMPGGFSYCFDAGQVKLLYAWRGGFLDLSGTLLRKTDSKRLTPTAALIGDIVWRAPAEYPVLFGVEKRIPARRFRGYKLVNGAPEFQYTLDAVSVRESVAAGGRRLTFDEIREPVFFEGKPVPLGKNVTVEGALP